MPKHVIILCVVSTSVIDSHPSASLQCSPLSLRQRAPLLHMNSQPTLVSLEISSYQSHLPSHFHHRSLPFSFFLSFFHSHKHTLSCIPFPLSSSPPLSFFHSFSLPFTHTHTPQHHGTTIQLLDTPGIIEGAAENLGQGRQVIATTRTADLVLMLLDAQHAEKQKELLTREIEAMHVRLNKKKPDVYIKEKKAGGIQIAHTVQLTHLDKALARDILNDAGLFHAEVVIREDITDDEFIDAVYGDRHYVKCLYVSTWFEFFSFPISHNHIAS